MPTRMPVEKEMQTQIRGKIKKDKRLEFPETHSRVGEIYLGKVYLVGNKGKKVIVKRIPLEKHGFWANGVHFNSIQTSLHNAFAEARIGYNPQNLANMYNNTIIKLRNSGVPLPKMKALIQDNELLLISQYFGNAKRGKLKRFSKDFHIKDLTHNELLEFLRISILIINAGFTPTMDLMEQFTGKNSTGMLPFDIDQLVLQNVKYETHPSLRIIDFFYFFLPHIISLGDAKAKEIIDFLMRKITDHRILAELKERLSKINE